MAYRKFYRNYPSKPTVRTITVKYAGKCACCGGMIAAGSIADFYPVGTIAGVQVSRIAHLKAMDGNSVACSLELKKRNEDKSLNAYAGDGLDARYEDDCAARCGF